MKDLDLSTIGGRIRACRKMLNLTLAALAEKIDVSANYISVIERGVQSPSEKVLHKIAESTNVSYWWLKTGQEDNPMSPASVQEAEPLNAALSNAIPLKIDAPLFLALVIQSTPNMTKEKLATILNTSPEEIDKALLGAGDVIPSSQADYFPILARQMDLPDIRQKLRTLDLFFQNENAEKERKQYLELAKRYVGSDYQYFRFEPVQQGASPTSESFYSEHIVFLKDESPQCENQNYGSWHFFFYRFTGAVDQSLVKSIMDHQISYCEELHGNLTLVFDDDRISELFEKDYNRRLAEDDALAGTPYDHGDNMLPTISLLSIDRETREPTHDIIWMEDNR